MPKHATPNAGPAAHQCDLLCPVVHLMRTPTRFVDPESTLRAASHAMVEQGVGAVVVLGPQGPTSIVTEHDIVRALADGADPDSVWTADVASGPLATLASAATTADAVRLMVDDGIRTIPVTANDEVVGLVTVDDILATLGQQWFG
ncbi:MAG: cyclic nucleotide-binding/CBS domain-containing protein [Acidimicrobiales bacterium]